MKLLVESLLRQKRKKYYSDSLIIATGGRSTPDLGSDGSGFKLTDSLGMKKSDLYPSLVQLKSNYGYLKHLKGTKVMAGVNLYIDDVKVDSDYGEVLFTDYGLSGPPILQLSREASKAVHKGIDKISVELDLLPRMDEDSLDELMIQRIENMPRKTLDHFFVGLLPKQLIVPLIKDNNFDMTMKAADISKATRGGLIVSWLKHFKVEITGTNQWNQSQVTAGGVDCREVNETNLSSLQYPPNVYLCGEILDMDGDCGGFNLQWAWSSGYVAGINAAKNRG